MRAFYSVMVLFVCCLSCTKDRGDHKHTATLASQDSIAVWINAVNKNSSLDSSSKLKYLDKAFVASLKQPKTRETADNLCKIAYLQLTQGDAMVFRKVNNALLVIAEEQEYPYYKGLAHWNYADLFSKKKPDSTYYHFREAYQNFSIAKLEDKKRDYPGRMLYAMANVKEGVKDYVGAEKDAVAALNFFKTVDKKDQLFNVYNLLAIIQNGLGKYDKAIDYHHKAKAFIAMAKKNKQDVFKTRSANNIAYTYLRKEDYKKAFELFSLLKKQKQLNAINPILYAKVLSSKAYSSFKLENDSNKANLLDIDRSNQILDSLQNTYSQARNYQYIAEIYAHDRDTLQAINNGLIAKNIAEQSGNNDRLLSVLELLTQLDKANGVLYAKNYIDLSQKLHKEEREIQDKFAIIQMETEEITKKNEYLAQRTELLAGISAGLLVLGIGVFTIVLQRISNQKLRFNQRQQESNQEIYNLMLTQHGKMEEGKKMEQKRISEELHDGILGQMLGIRLILSGLNERNDASAVARRSELIDKLQELEEEIRTISHELSNAAYSKTANFVLSIKDLIDTVEQSSGIAIHFSYDTNFNWDQLLSDIKINSYRIVQELLQNCVKHAQCKKAEVTFLNPENILILYVKDDGVGFSSTKGKRGIGLKNIISRVEKMGADLEIDAKPTQGTKITVTIPNINLKSSSQLEGSKQQLALKS